MNWLERYVVEVKRYLPRNSRDDVGEELYSLLSEKVEEREEQLERSLNEEENLELLKELGHPLSMASAYRSGRSLVSEQLFPLYSLVIKYFLLTLLTVYLLFILGVLLIDSPGFSLEGSDDVVLRSLLE